MPTQAEVNDAIETMGSLVSAAGGEGDEALDVLKDAVADGSVRDILASAPAGVVAAPMLDVGQLNDAAAVLWDEAHGRGARAGREAAQTAAAVEHCERLLDLARMLSSAAVGAEAEPAHRRRYAQLARVVLGRTPSMVDLGASLKQLDRALGPPGAPVDEVALANAAAAIEEAHAAAFAQLDGLRSGR